MTNYYFDHKPCVPDSRYVCRSCSMNSVSSHTPLFYVTLSGTRGFPKRYIENVMISAGSLWSTQREKFVRRNPPDHARFFLDSGGFNCLNRFGDYPWSHDDYVSLIQYYKPDFVATMDYPCEPDINRRLALGGDHTTRTSLFTNQERIEKTVEHTLALIKDPRVPENTTVIPVIQGYVSEEYAQCISLYEDAGLFMHTDYFALGSMCRRVAVPEIRDLLIKITDTVWSTHPNIKFHLFGLKLCALKDKAIADRAHSVDSAAWSLNPDRGFLYMKDPVGSGQLDNYLAKVERVCANNRKQKTLRMTNEGMLCELTQAGGRA